MTKETLRDLLIDDLRYIYHADRLMLRALPRFARRAKDEDVARLCREGIDYTNERLNRLQQAFALLNVKPRAKPSFAMAGLVEEARATTARGLSEDARDASVLAAVQKMTHYGIASYGTACAYAEAIGEQKVAKILGKSLKEKKEADVEMTQMAENDINPKIVSVEGHGETAKPAPRRRGRPPGRRTGQRATR
jgi:ferritin-like metal-binding protein YciE